MKLSICPSTFSKVILLSLAICTACNKDDDDKKPASNAYAIGSSNDLLIFNVTTPAETTSKTITGLQAGEAILGIDIRPANGQLYALGSTSRLYTIDKTTGAATVVGSGPFSPVINGTSFAFDFNPMVDRIRVSSNTEQNFRLNPETGVLAATDATINPVSAGISAAAYTNNTAGAASTVLYAIGATTDKLYRLDNPNSGTLIEVGALGVNVDASNGFDIAGTDKAYALLTVGGVTKLYTINLTTGAATAVGNFTGTVKGLAVLPTL